MLVTGGSGQLGRDLARALGPGAIALPHSELDVTDAAAVAAAVGDLAPGAIVNAAAWTDVDGCEGDRERARAVNGDGAANVARAAGDALVVQISTDYVFDGRAGRAYVEDDPPNPLSVYGRTKLEGEEAVRSLAARWAVVRSAWLYGAGGKNFVTSILRAAAGARDRLRVVDDQVGSPTATVDLAGVLVTLIEKGCTGTYHAVNAGGCSRFEFARAILEEAGEDPGRLSPVPTSAMPRPAARPAYAPLEGRAWRAAGLPPLRPWREALAGALPAILTALRGRG